MIVTRLLQRVVTFFRGHMGAVSGLERAQTVGQDLHFMLDCATRWNSTLMMFKRCQTLIPAVLSLHANVLSGAEDQIEDLDDIVSLVDADVQRVLALAIAVCVMCSYL